MFYAPRTLALMFARANGLTLDSTPANIELVDDAIAQGLLERPHNYPRGVPSIKLEDLVITSIGHEMIARIKETLIRGELLGASRHDAPVPESVLSEAIAGPSE